MSKRKHSELESEEKKSMAGLGAAVALGLAPALLTNCSGNQGIPALLGGRPARTKRWPGWPIWNPETDEEQVLNVIRSGVWSRKNVVKEFEQKWAETIGTKRCLAVINGTNAMITALVNLGIGGGDEVIVPPYTFVAPILAVIQTGAMPVFVDTDPVTFQIDANKIEAKITSRTRAILPVHILGLPADMERIMDIAKRHNLVVVEDACQGWLAEINNKKVGSFGNAGCFSFQTNKNIPIGEGGAIVSDDEEFMDRCYSYHNFGNPYGSVLGDIDSGTIIAGTKLRITEYQAAIGLAQMKRLKVQTDKRNENAAYLQEKLKKIPGIIPYELNKNVTRIALHIFAFRYKKEEFEGLSKKEFIKALTSEGVPCSGGYMPMNKMPYLANTFKTKNFKKMYPPEMLDYNKYMEQNKCPENDKLCEEAIWLTQNILLTEKADMDDIINAINKIRLNAEKLKKVEHVLLRIPTQDVVY